MNRHQEASEEGVRVSPVTGLPLKRLDIGGLEVDVGWGECGGIWFDAGELDKVDEPDEPLGEKLYEIPRNAELVIPQRAVRYCPVDREQPMNRLHFGEGIDLEIDECPLCGGIWLDSGELRKLREYFATAEDRLAVQRVVDRSFRENREFEEFLARRGRRGRRRLWQILGRSQPEPFRIRW